MPLTEKERSMYDAFTQDFTSCMACGIDPKRQICEKFPARWLECPHILGGNGQRKQKGETDRRNLLRLCKLCHDLAHHKTIRKPDRTCLPHLEREHMLWLKRHRDPDYFDLEFLNSISIRRMPEPECPPEWFVNQFDRWKPRTYQ